MRFETILRLPLAVVVAMGAMLSAQSAAAQPAAASAAASAPVRTYAIVPLIGDEFVVVTRRIEVGTNLNPNERTPLAVTDPVFDRIAADEVEARLLAAKPGTPVLRALIRDPRLFALQEKLLTESSESHDMRIALHDLLAKAGATDLYLVTKHRGPLNFRISTGLMERPGTLGGIGFYIDNDTVMYRNNDKPGGEGFLAPYAYLAISRIDVASMRVVQTRNGLETTAALPGDKVGGAAEHAWNALSGKEKVDALDRVIRRAVRTGMTGLIPE